MMSAYHTTRSEDGLRFPSSGKLVGYLAEALRLKAVLREDWSTASYKTAQRYLAGTRVSAETVDDIISTLASTLVPNSLRIDDDRQLAEVVARALRSSAHAWDVFAAEVNAHCYPVDAAADLAYAVLRLALLDMGLRWGAWIASRFVTGKASPWDRAWIERMAVRDYIDEKWLAGRRDGKAPRGPHQLSDRLKKLAKATGVSQRMVESWRKDAIPENKHIESLARALSKSSAERQRCEWELRLLFGVRALRRRLYRLCGEARIDDAIGAMTETALFVSDYYRRLLCPPKSTSQDTQTLLDLAPWMLAESRMWDLILRGAQSELGVVFTTLLSDSAQWRPEVSTDFQALPGDWVRRCQYWLRLLGRAPREVEFLRQYATAEWGWSDDDVAAVAPATLEHMTRMAGFANRPDSDGPTVRVIAPPFEAAINRVEQAERAKSVGDLAKATEHMHRAVELQPQNAGLQFKLGCYLWQLAFEQHRPLVEEALAACREAVRLDPEFGNARNEIGIILSNVGRYDEAEAAFGEAEPYFGREAHHWYARGRNYVCCDRLGDAREAFEKAIDLTAERAHVPAMALLAAVMVALGDNRSGRRLGKKVHFLWGSDPSENWEAVLASVRTSQSPRNV